MEESRPFLEAEIPDSRRNSSSGWSLKRGIRSGITTSRFSKSSLFSHSAVFITTSIIWGCIILLIVHFHPHTFQQTTKTISSQPQHNKGFLATEIDYLTCGTSLQEAKDRGCVYDILDNHWIPGQCADEFSIKEYQMDGSWFPYADENRTMPLTREELGDRKMYYTSKRDHIVHCAALWRRQFRALSEGWKYVDSVLTDPEHTMHCSKYLVDASDHGPDFRTVPIEVMVSHAGCHVRAD